MSSDTIRISVNIPNKILAKIDNMSGKSRNEKIVRCIAIGYEALTKR